MRCTNCPAGAIGPSWRSIAARSRRRCCNRSCSGTRRAPSPVRPGGGRACSNPPTAAPSSWTKWATCRRMPRSACCACCRKAHSSGWAATSPSRSTCGSSRPPTWISNSRWRRAGSGATSTTGSMSCACRCRPCGIAPATSNSWPSISLPASAPGTPPVHAASARRRAAHCASTIGLATCASCSTAPAYVFHPLHPIRELQRGLRARGTPLRWALRGRQGAVT